MEYLLGELSGERLAETVSRDVDDALKIAEKLTVAEVLDRDRAKAVARKYVALAGDSAVIELLAKELAQAVYQLAAADDHKLGEVIGREHVEALVDKVLSMHTLRDRLLERLADSPVVASVASWFVNKIVTDFLQHNQEIAERTEPNRMQEQ